MTEFDKMLRGELYDANFDPRILKEHMNAENLCFDYNNLRPDDPKRMEILGMMGKRRRYDWKS